MLTVQILSTGQVQYYTQGGSDEYYVGTDDIEARFIGEGYKQFGIKDTQVVRDDERFKNLMKGFSIDGEKELRKGAGIVRTYNYFEKSKGEKVTYKDTLYLSEREVEQVKNQSRDQWSKRLQHAPEFQKIDSSWLHSTQDKKNPDKQWVTLVNPANQKEVRYDRVHAPTKKDVWLINQKDFSQKDVVKLSLKTQSLIREWEIDKIKQSLQSEKRGSRPGADFTFSATKDVSILYALETDPVKKALIKSCHDDAVNAVVKEVEKDIYIRKGAGGEVLVKADASIIAVTHETSRALDPQLHTHGVMPNLGIAADGSSGAIEYLPLMKKQHAYGALYQNEVRRLVEERLGLETYDIKRTEKETSIQVPLAVRVKGQEAINNFTTNRAVKNSKNFGYSWGVKGVTNEVRHLFSKRSRDIEEKQIAGMTYDQKQKIVLETRKKKDNLISKEELEKSWHAQAKSIGFSPNQVYKQRFLSLKKVGTNSKESQVLHRDVLTSLTPIEWRNGVTEGQLISAVVAISQGKQSNQQIMAHVESLKQTCFDVHEMKKGQRFTFNKEGIKRLHYRTNLEKAYATHHKVKGAISHLKYIGIKNKALGLLLTGKISHRQYNKIIKPKPLPKNKLAIKFLHATGKISYKHMKYELKKIDYGDRQKLSERGLRFTRFDVRNRNPFIKRTKVILHDAFEHSVIRESKLQTKLNNRSKTAPPTQPTEDVKKEKHPDYER